MAAPSQLLRLILPARAALRCVYCVEVSAGPHEDRLIKRIFYDNHYYQSSRPVLNESSAIEVKFGLSLQQIIDVVSLGQLKHSVR